MHQLKLLLWLCLSCPIICIAGTPDNTAKSNNADNSQAGKSTDASAVGKIVVISHPIFDESAPDAFFIHRWANFLHINTQESTVKNLLSFKEGDEVTQKDLDETLRLLRAEPYLRDATINFAKLDPEADETSEQRDVVVETWDNWSLLPTVSASRNGGNTKYSFGVKEDNLLGMGIRTRLKYQSNQDRTGYKVAFKVPLTIVPHGTFAADFFDNSDGQASHVYFERPFYTLDGKLMYSAEAIDDTRIDTVRQNGIEVNEFEHSNEFINLRYGMLGNKTKTHLWRWIAGVTKDTHEFERLSALPITQLLNEQLPNEQFPNEQLPITELPQNRDFLYPWLGWQYIQDDYRVLNNVYLINYSEDFNLGWQHFVRFGVETQDIDKGVPGWHLDAKSSVGFSGDDSLLLLWFNGNGTFNTLQKDNFQLSSSAEYFYHINPKWTAYGKAMLSTSNNTYLDASLSLGDETGIRGYPNDYQHGDHQWLLSAELRNYPNINLYQLAELGWATFIDVGQAFGGPQAKHNEVQDPIGAIGIGARIYSSRSSYGNVAHIDITRPFTSGEQVDEWGWRILIRDRF